MTDYNRKKVNYPEKIPFYVKKSFLTIQKDQKMFYGDNYILGQMQRRLMFQPTLRVTNVVLKNLNSIVHSMI